MEERLVDQMKFVRDLKRATGDVDSHSEYASTELTSELA